MKKHVLLFLLIGHFSYAQNTVSLDSCVAWAKRNYPQLKQNGLILQQTNLNDKALRENWYPKLNFLAQATVNSEVVKLNFPGMATTAFPHDAYLTSLGLEQTLFDGGQTKLQRQIESKNTQLELQKNEVELYRLVERINQLYINILLGRENLNVLGLYKIDLENRRANIKSGIENGLVLESALDEVDAEVLKTEQSTIETQANLKSFYENLALFVNQKIDEATKLSEEPLGGFQVSNKVTRAELTAFDLQKELLAERYKLTTKLSLPRISVGAAANYGRPGPNFINQDLRFFGSANLSLRWNISSLYGLKREKKKVEIAAGAVDLQRELFLFNLTTTLNTQRYQLEAINKMIEKDDAIITKRSSVTKTAVAQMENGKITVANYIAQLNAELQAKLVKKTHQIRLMNTISTINATNGIVKF